MKTEHTPGPWSHNGLFVIDSRGLNIFGDTKSMTEKDANAKLIAAAPELLEALHLVLKEAQGLSLETLTKAFDAAKKATL